MTRIQEYDRVRVIRIIRPDREFEGTDGVARSPRVGDVATVCHEYQPDDSTAIVAVEMVDSRGYTVWLADFDRTELELVSRPAVNRAERNPWWRFW